MRSAVRFCSLGLALSVALLAVSAPAAAAPSRITGKLSKPGYTVIALAASGKARSVRANRGGFTLRPPAKRVTLHLRAADGRYAGPIVVASRRKGRRAILGVSAGARLGRISVRRDYARVRRRLRTEWLDANRLARARRGVPIGARVFGRVRSNPPRASIPGDLDADGIPQPLDIDDDGDLILDNLDRSSSGRSAQIQGVFVIVSGLFAGLGDTVNANAAAVTSEQVDVTLSNSGNLKLRFVLGDSEELDCRGLAYCSSGGTGRVQRPGDRFIADMPPFPDCCDPDGDGFGTLQPQPGVRDAMVLHHGATSAQIGTGDILIERVTTSGVETQYPASMEYVFATVPALVSYSDGQGNSATLSYPVKPTPELKDGFPVAAGPSGDVIVTLTYWRPQRRPIPGEACLADTPPCDWIDIGRLEYSLASGGVGCPREAIAESDPDLTPIDFSAPPGEAEPGGLRDLAADRPANAANSFSFTLNLTQCLASAGLSFNPGESRDLGFAGNTTNVGKGGGNTAQSILFQRR